ncbi:unnamed protein product [Neospora caninum Liverpool]|uniref:AP2-coincident C-terminal domain-containing protein n=1 Tax=Neospora caninum (strain Liverpool) TaxID=572307 RepID=F0VER9_NEOCL|nr:uncharacterized protein NCLIV_020020 [Neospora caninum Liverpool]CBZ52213.1 unnamed protein product [Neospora caninum Liverpool]|eukprot:XP_003882245.1 uncharacterized protein NCLIV_020020 [Neospora caninum Liverpool]
MQQSSVVWRAGLLRPAHGHNKSQVENPAKMLEPASNTPVPHEHRSSPQALKPGFIQARCLPPSMMNLNNGDMPPKDTSSTVCRSGCRDQELMVHSPMACHQNSIIPSISSSSIDSAAFSFEDDSKQTEGRSLSILEESTVECSLPPLSRMCSINLSSPSTSPVSAHTSASPPHSLVCADLDAPCGIDSSMHASADSAEQPSDQSDSSTFQSASTASTPPDLFQPVAAKLVNHVADPDLSSGCTLSTSNSGLSVAPQKHSRDSSDTTSTAVCSELTGSGVEGGSLASHYAGKLLHPSCTASTNDGTPCWSVGGSLCNTEESSALQTVESGDSCPLSVPSCQEPDCAAACRQPPSHSGCDKSGPVSFSLVSPGSRSNDSDSIEAASPRDLADTAATSGLSSVMKGQEVGVSEADAATAVGVSARIEEDNTMEAANSVDDSSDTLSTAVVVPRGVWYNRSTCCWLACVSGVGKRLYVFSAKRLGFDRARQMAIDCKNGCLTPEGLAAASDDSGGGNRAAANFATKCRRITAVPGKVAKSDRAASVSAGDAEWRSSTEAGWAHHSSDIGEIASSGLAVHAPSSGGSIAGDGSREDDSTGVDTPGALSRSRSAECSKEVIPVSEDGAASKEDALLKREQQAEAPERNRWFSIIAANRMITQQRLLERPAKEGVELEYGSTPTRSHGLAQLSGHVDNSWCFLPPATDLRKPGQWRSRRVCSQCKLFRNKLDHTKPCNAEALEPRRSRRTLMVHRGEQEWSHPAVRVWGATSEQEACLRRPVEERCAVSGILSQGTPHRRARSGRTTELFGTRPSTWDDSPSQRQELGRCTSIETVEHKQLTEKEQQLLCAGKLATNLVLSDLLEVCLPQLELSPTLLDRVRSSLEVAVWAVSSAQHPAELQSFLRLFSCCFIALKIPSNMPSQTRVHLIEALTGTRLKILQESGDLQDDVQESGEAPVSDEELGGDRK